jgi:hypothetical protein
MTLNTYGGIFDELDGAERVGAEAAIGAARDECVSEKCPPLYMAGGGEQ